LLVEIAEAEAKCDQRKRGYPESPIGPIQNHTNYFVLFLHSRIGRAPSGHGKGSARSSRGGRPSALAAPAAWRCWRRCAASRVTSNAGCLRAARKERQRQNRLPGFILYDHHQGRIVVPALFSQLPGCALGMRKCRRNIRQVRTMRIILDPVPSAYCEEISHQTPPSARRHLVFCIVISLNVGRQSIDVDQSRAPHQRRSNSGGWGLSNSAALRTNA
jgi:hypothetical protein